MKQLSFNRISREMRRLTLQFILLFTEPYKTRPEKRNDASDTSMFVTISRGKPEEINWGTR